MHLSHVDHWHDVMKAIYQCDTPKFIQDVTYFRPYYDIGQDTRSWEKTLRTDFSAFGVNVNIILSLLS